MSGSLDVLAVEQEYTISYMEAECEQLEEERLHADKELKEQAVKTADLKATVDEMITKAKRLSYLKQKLKRFMGTFFILAAASVMMVPVFGWPLVMQAFIVLCLWVNATDFITKRIVRGA
ncbi:hypothetical protein ACK3TF_002132 [Chlorella vulgaris]